MSSDWTIRPLSAALGASVAGVDLGAELPAADRRAIVDLLAEHLVLVFHHQHLTPDRHVEIGRIFGEPFIHPFLDALLGHPTILEVIKEPDDTHTFGGEHWHADITFMDPPSSVSVLHAVEVPPIGGDTLFANQHLAHDRLSPGMRRLLSNLGAVHLYPGMDEGEPNTTAVHPVVRTHPVNGRPALFVNPAFVSRFDGMTAAESQPLLDQLFRHQISPELCGRVSWQPGQVTVWDNRSVLHYAMNDHPGHRRELHRVTAMEPQSISPLS